jgi:superfamily I DNA/RNA helicase
MTITPTAEQLAIIADELDSQCIIACAGSGKTATAVRRMLEIRRRLENHRGYVALLSYSNVAVDTFRKEYALLEKRTPGISNRVLISTVDSFITTHILLPHAAREMRCKGRPFLVRGTEPFLNGFKVYNGKHNVGIEHLRVSINEKGSFTYSEASFPPKPNAVEEKNAEKTIHRLGEIGAYTHELARYWSLRTLIQDERLLEILACRYPYVLIDEAQDIGSIHALMLSILQGAGSKLSLIGDPNQAIYEFADADGSFLKSFEKESGITAKSITQNRRSVREIVIVANSVCSYNSEHIRTAPERKHGAYYLTYDDDKLDALVDTFASILGDNGYSKANSAILCRGNPLVERISGGADETGQAATDKFACATIYRDRQRDISTAFEFFIVGVLKLLAKPPATLRKDILNNSANGEAKILRRLLWIFLKGGDTGLPDAALLGKSKWHPLLKKRLPSLLGEIECSSSLRRSDKWVYSLTTKDLTDAPLWQRDIATEDTSGIRIQTVHKVKGESIDAVLFIAKKAELKSLLTGTSSEEGRIGYVAITRARDLFLLAVPTTTSKAQVAELESKGFEAWV